MANRRSPPKRTPKKSGPEAQTIRIEGDWRDAMKKAIRKPRPTDGWPKPQARRTPDK